MSSSCHSRIFICCALLIAAATAGIGPSRAQKIESTTMELGGVRLSLSAQELKALSELGQHVASRNRAVQDRALAEARRVARGSDARFALATYELEIGRRRGDDALRKGALDVLIASTLTRAEKLPGYLGIRGQIAYREGDLALADQLWTRWAALAPADPEVAVNLAQVRLARGDAAAAAALLQRAIAAREAAGQVPPQAWLRQQLAVAHKGKLAALGTDAACALVEHYPSPENWRIALVTYRQLAALEDGFEIDLYRLMRHQQVIAQGDEYRRFAQLLLRAAQPLEARAVFDEGAAKALIDPATSPAREVSDEIDRALAKRTRQSAPAPSAPAAALRAAVAQLRAGPNPAAEAALRAAAADPANAGYADLARFWLLALRR